jgi:TonB family protein
VIARLAAYDRQYRRNMSVTVPVAAALCGLALFTIPRGIDIRSAPERVSFRGPLKVLPELDIQDREVSEEQLTAAPRGAPPADFTVIDIDYAEDPRAEPRPEMDEPRAETQDTTPETSEIDWTQNATKTTSHPILSDTQYELLYMERPVYPRAALEKGIEGDVEILMLVDTRGKVTQAKVVNPNRYPLLERAAQDAVSKSIFRVYMVKGRPTAFWVRVPVEFRIVN